MSYRFLLNPKGFLILLILILQLKFPSREKTNLLHSNYKLLLLLLRFIFFSIQTCEQKCRLVFCFSSPSANRHQLSYVPFLAFGLGGRGPLF